MGEFALFCAIMISLPHGRSGKKERETERQKTFQRGLKKKYAYSDELSRTQEVEGDIVGEGEAKKKYL